VLFSIVGVCIDDDWSLIVGRGGEGEGDETMDEAAEEASDEDGDMDNEADDEHIALLLLSG
jgi:hypothetical protein